MRWSKHRNQTWPGYWNDQIVFKITVINILRTLRDKVDSKQEHMGNVSREMEILRKNQKEMLEIKNTVTEVKKNLSWAY